MRVHFHGTAGVVTGSMHVVVAAGRRALFDRGMRQPSPDAEAGGADPFPVDVASLDALVVSRAHIVHVGRLPLLVLAGEIGERDGIEVALVRPGVVLDA